MKKWTKADIARLIGMIDAGYLYDKPISDDWYFTRTKAYNAQVRKIISDPQKLKAQILVWIAQRLEHLRVQGRTNSRDFRMYSKLAVTVRERGLPEIVEKYDPCT